MRKSLSNLLETIYHGKVTFDDFLNINVESHVTKIHSKKRTIYKVSDKLKLLHSFLNLVVFEYLKVNKDVLYSYIKGRNVIDAVQAHSSGKYFYTTDLETFFGSISSDMVKDRILASAAEIPVSDVLQYADRIVELVTIDSTLPIGFSTSPSISNACLYEFDNRVQNRTSELEVTYTRYADDIIFSSHSKESLATAIQLIEPILQELFGDKIRINQSKNRTISVGKKVKILGVNILPNGKLTVDRKIKDRVETTLHYFKTNRAKYEELLSENDDSKLERISGSLNYIKTIDPNYLNKLRKKYGSTTVDMFLRKSVK